MKHLKLFLFAFVSLVIISCGDDDDPETTVNDTPNISFNVTAAISRPANDDISSLVTFNAQQSLIYTSVLKIGDRLTLSRPTSLGVNDGFLYLGISLLNEDTDELIFFDTQTLLSDDGNLTLIIPDGESSDYYINSLGVPLYIIEVINDLSSQDINYKYTIEVIITRNAVEYGPYIIDPKIRIVSLN